MNKDALKNIDPRLWLIIVLGVIIVGFCLFKAISATGLRRSPTDRPAPAFAPIDATLITSDAYLNTPRLPTDIYLGLSDRAAAVAGKALHGNESITSLERQGMSSSQARRRASFFANISKTLRGLSLTLTPYTLTSLSFTNAIFSSSVQISDQQSGSPPKNGTLTVTFTSTDKFKHSQLADMSFSIS
jgi:hypothetical protein